MNEKKEFASSIKDKNGKEILVGSIVRLSELGKTDFKKIFPKIYAETPNFRCKIIRIEPNGNVYGLPIEIPDNALVREDSGKTRKLIGEEFMFSPQEIIVE